MTREMSLTELISELPPTIDPGKFIADLLRSISRLRRQPLAGPRSLRVDGVTMMVDLQPKQAVIVHFNGHQVNVRVPL